MEPRKALIGCGLPGCRILLGSALLVCGCTVLYEPLPPATLEDEEGHSPAAAVSLRRDRDLRRERLEERGRNDGDDAEEEPSMDREATGAARH